MATVIRPQDTQRDDRPQLRVVVETEEHEKVEFEGCSKTEVEAKLHDFLAWAS